MTTIEDIRRANGRDLIRIHGASTIAQLLGHGSPSTLSQIFGPNPTRQPTEKLARKIESALNLKPLSMDAPPAVQPAPQVSGVTEDTVALAI
jgi:hypothetical protein